MTSHNKSRVARPVVTFSMRNLQKSIKEQLTLTALALDMSQEEVANSALRIGLNVMQRKIAKGELE